MSGDRLDRIREHLARAEVSRQPGLSLHLYLAAEDVAWMLAEVETWRDLAHQAEAQADRGVAAGQALSAEVARLRSLLAEPSEEEVWRLACLAGEPPNAMEARLRVEWVRRILADLRERAGGERE